MVYTVAMSQNKKALLQQLHATIDHIHFAYMVLHQAEWIRELQYATGKGTERSHLESALLSLEQIAEKIHSVQEKIADNSDHPQLESYIAYVRTDPGTEMEKVLHTLVTIARRHHVDIPSEIQEILAISS